MICLICRKAETVEGLTHIEFARGEFRLIVKSVPARICPGCGETYAAEAIVVSKGAAALTIDALAKAMNISKGGVQYAFTSKDVLVSAQN